MAKAGVSRQDVLDAQGGKVVVLPLVDGGRVSIRQRRNGTYLTVSGQRDTITVGQTPGEGETTETSPDVSQ